MSPSGGAPAQLRRDRRRNHPFAALTPMPDFDSFYWELPDDLVGALRSADVELQDGSELEEVALCRAPGSKS